MSFSDKIQRQAQTELKYRLPRGSLLSALICFLYHNDKDQS